MKNIFLFFLLFTCTILAQVGKVLVSGLGGTIDDNNITAFNAGYSAYDGSVFGGVIEKFTDVSADASASFSYANTNNYKMIIRSTTGLSNVISVATGYPSILVFMPAGDNNFTQVFMGDINTSPVVVTGCGDTQNRTGYNIEFWGPNPLSSPNDGFLSAYSNAYIAGQMAFLANYGATNLSQVRTYCRLYGDPYSNQNGYGVVKTSSIISSALPVELISFVATLEESGVTLSWQTATEINNYGFDIERASLDSWEKIGFAKGNGNSNSLKCYSFTDKNLPAGEIKYRLKQIDLDGKYEYGYCISVIVDSKVFAVKQNYPNPFNPTTTIEYSIAEPGNIILKIYNMLGEEIATLVNEQKTAGKYEAKFDASKLSSGMYIYKIQAGNFVQTKKMVLLK